MESTLTSTQRAALREAIKGTIATGGMVWVPSDDDDVFKQATPVEYLADGDTVKLATGESLPIHQVKPIDTADREESDLVQMANIDIPNILHTLRCRHINSEVYTSVGQKGILISVNPYRWIEGLYDTEVMHEHYAAFANTKLPPHIFSLSSRRGDDTAKVRSISELLPCFDYC